MSVNIEGNVSQVSAGNNWFQTSGLMGTFMMKSCRVIRTARGSAMWKMKLLKRDIGR